jgi:hypothetical protein
MPGNEFEQGYILGCHGGVEKGAGGMSAHCTSNGKGTVVDAASGGTEARFINGPSGLSGVGANVEFCVDNVRGKSNGLVHAKCVSTVKRGAQFFVDHGCAW